MMNVNPIAFTPAAGDNITKKGVPANPTTAPSIIPVAADKPSDTLSVTNKDKLSAADLQGLADEAFGKDEVSVRVDSEGNVIVKSLKGNVTMADIKKQLGLKDGVIRNNNFIEGAPGENPRVSDNSSFFNNSPKLDKLTLNKGYEITIPQEQVGLEQRRFWGQSDLAKKIMSAK